jgi:predicted RNA-binding protein
MPEDGKVRIINLFGEEVLVAGRITHIDLLSHKIVISR